MEQLLNHLRHLGFTELEAKVMVSLTQQGTQSGYEVAKRLGVSRSNVYATLQRLVSRGVIQLTPGEPARYTMMPIKEFTQMISGQMGESLTYLEQHMPSETHEQPSFFIVEGERKVIETLNLELDKASEEIVAGIWREEAKWSRQGLERAEQRGVRVLWSFEGDEDGKFSGMLPLTASQQGGRKFWLVVDRRWCIVGMRGDELPAQAIVTEHPLMVELLLQHFAQEIILFELENDLGAELIQRYGEGYEHILNKYMPSFVHKDID